LQKKKKNRIAAKQRQQEKIANAEKRDRKHKVKIKMPRDKHGQMTYVQQVSTEKRRLRKRVLSQKTPGRRSPDRAVELKTNKPSPERNSKLVGGGGAKNIQSLRRGAQAPKQRKTY